MSDFKYIGRNIVCEPYTFRSSITASNISASDTITANRFIGYMDSSSVSISSSYALTASYALNGGSGGTPLITGSTYPITASWSINSVSSSWAATAISSAFAYSSSFATTASYFSGSISDAINAISASYALTASYALNGGSGGGGIFVATSSVININISSSVDKFITDGVTNTYTLTLSSNNESEILVFLDGLEQEPITDYTVSGTTLTMIPIPPPNLELEARKFYSAATINIITSSLNAQYFTGDGITTQYSLTKSVSNDYDVLVSFDGLIQKPTYDYTITGSILNFTSPPPINIDGEIRYLMTSTTGLVSSGSGGGANLTTGSTYPITSSSAISSSYALTASYALNGAGGGSLTTGSTYQITSSWSLNSNTSSYVNTLNQIVILSMVSSSLQFIDDAAAALGGVPLGGLYRNGNFILIRIT